MIRRTLMLMTLLGLCGSLPLAAQKPTAVAKVAPASEIVNLNTATAAQIATLPGIGLKTAELIVQYRLKQGGFKKIEEIMNVRGVGEKSFLKLKSRLTVTPVKADGN